MEKVELEEKSNGFLHIKTLWSKTSSGNLIDREYMSKTNGCNESVSVLLLDNENEEYILVKQYRTGIHEIDQDPYLIETVAGMVDQGELPLDALKREVLEETGYTVKNIEFIDQLYSSPACMDEKNYMYIAEIDEKISDGGGKEDEEEEIEVIHVKFKDVNHIKDLKTKFLINAHKLSL